MCSTYRVPARRLATFFIDLHAGSSDRADLLADPEEKEVGPRARAGLIRCIFQCMRLGENVNDFVQRLVDEGALTECSATDERCVHLETGLAAPSSCSGRAPLLCLLEALGQMFLECMSIAERCVLWRRLSMPTSSRLQVNVYLLQARHDR